VWLTTAERLDMEADAPVQQIPPWAQAARQQTSLLVQQIRWRLANGLGA
jgi:NADH dehydrogenase FAD-containing subunit